MKAAAQQQSCLVQVQAHYWLAVWSQLCALVFSSRNNASWHLFLMFLWELNKVTNAKCLGHSCHKESILHWLLHFISSCLSLQNSHSWWFKNEQLVYTAQHFHSHLGKEWGSPPNRNPDLTWLAFTAPYILCTMVSCCTLVAISTSVPFLPNSHLWPGFSKRSEAKYLFHILDILGKRNATGCNRAEVVKCLFWKKPSGNNAKGKILQKQLVSAPWVTYTEENEAKRIPGVTTVMPQSSCRHTVRTAHRQQQVS